MRNSLLNVLFFVVGVSIYGCSSYNGIAGKASFNRYISKDTVLGKGTTGLELIDPSDGKALTRFNSEHYFTPASNTKLLTYYTGIKILGDSIPSIRYCYRNDSLLFSGLGDPTLLRPDFPCQPVFDFLKNCSDTLVYIPLSSREKRFGPGWAWDDYPYDYSAEKSAFPVFGNLVQIKTNTGDSIPDIYPYEFKDSMNISFDTLHLPTDDRVIRNEFSNKFNVALNLADSMKTDVPFIYHTGTALGILSDSLNKKIYYMDSAGYCDWKILKSLPTDSVMKVMLNNSDNFIAEQILILCSALLNDTISTDWAIRYASDSIFPGMKDNMTWVDGSGLSRYNLQTPENLVKLLYRIYKEIPMNKIRILLPGYGPGLKTLNKGDPSIFIYAKSGSMTHVYNLSGFLLTRKGKILIFSLMNNNFHGNVPEARLASGKILEWIREKY